MRPFSLLSGCRGWTGDAGIGPQAGIEPGDGVDDILALGAQDLGDAGDFDVQGEALVLGVAMLDQPDAGEGGLPDVAGAEDVDARVNLALAQDGQQARLVAGPEGHGVQVDDGGLAGLRQAAQAVADLVQYG